MGTRDWSRDQSRDIKTNNNLRLATCDQSQVACYATTKRTTICDLRSGRRHESYENPANYLNISISSIQPLESSQRPTFRPKKRKHHPSGSNVSGLSISDHVVEKPFTATLVSYNLREAVKLPYDGIAIKKPITVSAPEYVGYLMNWIATQIDNGTIFPQTPEATFPANFKDFVKVILKRLFRVYAHIYHCHFQKVVNLKEEAHLNTCFEHLVLFTSEYQLIDEAEMEPLSSWEKF
uniref:Mob1/phocein family protein n=1 Tax=Brassica oleracea var. oleracea TaxID=109376 RepID=A0A0D3EDT1_BRAOL